MFLATTLVYPLVLAVLCAGAGLLVDRTAGGKLPGALLISVGAAALIALSQLSTYLSALAAATPYLMAAAALAGYVLGRGRAIALARRAVALRWAPALPVLAYLIAIAPVLLAGRPTFSSFMALSDSAFHMMGADFLMRHGQDFTHLDLRNSSGQFINDYYDASYPSGADALFGGSAFLLGLPLIWAFQPFTAFMLASATGPAWLIARRTGLAGALAGAASLTAVLAALVYGYALVGSIKEVVAITMILTLGSLVLVRGTWLAGPAVRATPFALVLAAGVSALGVAFGAWALVAVAVLAVVVLSHVGRAGRTPRGLPGVLAAGAIVVLVAAWPTWRHLSGSIKVAQDIAATGNAGNLHSPLRAEQVLGVWLRGSYKLAPGGFALLLTDALIAAMIALALLGALRLLRRRAYVLAGWFAGMLVAWLAVTELVTTWASAKTLVLTSPAVVLLSWSGVAALRAFDGPRAIARAGAPAIAAAIGLGELASDALQYHEANLAPTARYQELAALNSRYRGMGPALFTDFDEYAMYELRDLDIGGPDFAYPPPALAGVTGGYGYPVELDRASPSALTAYPLIITRRDPTLSRPPAAYGLARQGAYYEVWTRRPGAPAALAHLGLAGTAADDCRQIGSLASLAAREHARLVAADAPEIVPVPLAPSTHPARWGHQRGGLVMRTAGRLSASFTLPSAGRWLLWVQGLLMPSVDVGIDGRPPASIGGELSGNSLVTDTVPPIPVRLAAGSHTLAVTRHGLSLAPGDGGAAVLARVVLTPAAAAAPPGLSEADSAGWRALCGARHQWVEVVRR